MRCVGFGADLVTGGWFSIVGSLDGSVDGTKIVLPRLRAIQKDLSESVIGWVRTDAIEQGVDPHRVRYQEMQRVFGYPLYHGLREYPLDQDTFYELVTGGPIAETLAVVRSLDL